VAVVGVALFVVLQLAIPISRMGSDEGPQRFGWQMFSTVGEAIEFTVHTPTGTVIIDLEDVMARARSDVPLEELLPPHLCNTVEGAESVTWDDKSYQCLTG
jgi:hypothetical protein